LPAPRLNDMPADFRASLPALSLDVHSYDPDPKRRFVLINLTKLKEGQRLLDDIEVVEILAAGVLLDRQGTRFLLPAGG
jgi:general secretion pathway protein B